MRRLSYLVTLAGIALLTIMPAAGAHYKGWVETGVVAIPVQDEWSVYIKDYFYSPPVVAVKPGSTITWINKGDEPHTVTADDGSFDSGVLKPGDSFTVAFAGRGTVTYYCALHPSMRGSVTVSRASGGGAGGTGYAPAAPTYYEGTNIPIGIPTGAPLGAPVGSSSYGY